MKNQSSIGFPSYLSPHPNIAIPSSNFYSSNTSPQKQAWESKRNNHQNIFSEKYHNLPILKQSLDPNLRQEYKIGESRDKWLNHVEEKRLPPIEVYDCLLDKTTNVSREPYVTKEKSFYAQNYSQGLKQGFNINASAFRKQANEFEKVLPIVLEFRSPKKIIRPEVEDVCSKKGSCMIGLAGQISIESNNSHIKNNNSNYTDIFYNNHCRSSQNLDKSNNSSQLLKHRKQSLYQQREKYSESSEKRIESSGSLESNHNNNSEYQSNQRHNHRPLHHSNLYSLKRPSILQKSMMMERTNFFLPKNYPDYSNSLADSQKIDRFLEKAEEDEDLARQKYLEHDVDYSNSIEHSLNKETIVQALKDKEIITQQSLGINTSFLKSPGNNNFNNNRVLGWEESFSKAKDLVKSGEFMQFEEEIDKFSKQIKMQSRPKAWMNHNISPQQHKQKITTTTITQESQDIEKEKEGQIINRQKNMNNMVGTGEKLSKFAQLIDN